jgi:hypothetical protein
MVRTTPLRGSVLRQPGATRDNEFGNFALNLTGDRLRMMLAIRRVCTVAHGDFALGGGPSVAMRSFSFGSFFVPKPSVAPDCLRESALSSGGLTPLGEGCKPSRLCLTVVASSHVSAGPRLVLRPRVRPGPIAPGTTRPASTTPRPTSLRVGRHGRSQTIRPGGKLAPRSHLVPAERGRAAERLGP